MATSVVFELKGTYNWEKNIVDGLIKEFEKKHIENHHPEDDSIVTPWIIIKRKKISIDISTHWDHGNLFHGLDTIRDFIWAISQNESVSKNLKELKIIK